MSLRRTGWFRPFLKLAKQKVQNPGLWPLVLLVVFSLVVPVLLHSPRAEAAGNSFVCKDDAGSAITGPTVPGQNDGVTYKRDSQGRYTYTSGTQTTLITTDNGQDCGTKNSSAHWLGPGSSAPLVIVGGIQGHTASSGGGGNTANLNFNWLNSGEIDASNGNKYVADSNSPTKDGQNIFYQANNDEGNCKDTVNSLNVSTANLVISVDGGNFDKGSDAVSYAQSKYGYQNIKSNLKSATHVGNCWVLNAVQVTLGNQTNSTLPPTTGSNSKIANSCESSGGGALSWIACPVIEALDSTTSWLDSQIQSLLIVPNPQSAGSGLHDAWASVRNIALLLLIPIMLVMVIGTALNLSFIDAYTVRRAMPRFLIAVLFISISWYLTAFMITLTNAVGRGVLGLLTAPFDQGTGNSLAALVNVGTGAVVSYGGLVVFGGLLLGGFVSFGIIMSFAFVAVIALLIGFTVLTLRQLILLMLVILSPLAILGWIFPGNDKIWKIWWDSFSRLLLMFPLIMALIAIGKDFAIIIGKTTAYSGLDSMVKQLMIIIAYVIPYFFIPWTFKVAGGLFATLSGMVNDRSRGLFDRQKQKRTERRKADRERASMNRRFNPNGRLRGLNTLSSYAADPYHSAIFGRTRGGKALAAEVTQKAATQSQDLAKWFSQAGFNQEALTAIMQNVEGNNGRLNMTQLQTRIGQLSGSDSAQERAAAEQLTNSSGFLNNVYQSEEFGRANIGMAAGYAKAAQGFVNSEDGGELARYSNFLNGVAPGLGDTFKTQAGLMNAQAGGLTKVGYSEQIDRDGNVVAGGVAARSIQMSRTSVQELAGGKASQIKRHFFDNGAMDSILSADTSSPETATITDALTGEKITVTDARKEALLDTVAQAAYGYNTPAETAEVLRTKLDSLVGEVDEKGRATTINGQRAQDAIIKASRTDPSRFGGLDKEPPPKE